MTSNKDKRLFIRLDLDYADHPKIMGLSDAAFRAHITFLLYSRKYMTDGVINNRVANRVASQWETDVLTELATNDEANPSLIELSDGDYYLHGYEDMQETRAEIESRTARNKANGAKGGRPRKTQSVSESGTQTITQTKAETETETETETVSSKELTRRGSRVPDSFEISDEMRSWAKEHTPLVDVDAKLPEWLDYWRGVAGQKGVKLDWVGTWRNGMRKQQEFAERDGVKPRGIDPDAWMDRSSQPTPAWMQP